MNLNKSACKVPVIMYNESFFNRKADLTSSTIQLSRGKFNESSEDLTKVAKILRKNE